MRHRLVGRHVQVSTPRTPTLRTRLPCLRTFTHCTQLTTNSRPNLPFLAIPVTTNGVRTFTTERRQWLKHEAKLAVRYTASFWGLLACFGVILFFVNEERLEQEYPTPHEWGWMTRKFLRDSNNSKAPKNGETNWPWSFELARGLVLRLEDPKVDGQGVTKLTDRVDPEAEIPGEFNPCDISDKSEEWRRGYFEAIMLAAKGAEHVDGWVRDLSRNIISPPEFVIGPSNPRPTPIPPGQPHAPREEDCEIAYPNADNFYMKILGTKGFTSRQKLEATLEYASYLEFKKQSEGAEALYHLALAEATQGVDMSQPPYNPKTFVLNEKAGLPSQNVLDAVTAMASFKARSGKVDAALPIYLSLLKARRYLPNDPHPTTQLKPKSHSVLDKVVKTFSQADYPPPPPDGTQPPWRSPHERCQEASLSLWIGEILFSTSSKDDGLSWTRDSVDVAEEQLRDMDLLTADQAAKTTCRECLSAGLANWGKMVNKLAREEELQQAKASTQSSVFSFWSATPPSAEDRWTAEEAVVRERVRRTRELIEDLTPAGPNIASLFKA
ncbi:major facilitator superfamily transporter [Fusarium circinatum]|uniref:Major facilitator superfamily transporter n=1 Tax=Fusarium circinatum TaxID=48490 RepID=A0A8H5U3Q6_FUSCI|nr:major facilitator superfamily transporter [Fusarium circinatum]